jgi:putative ABC transport system permease protein
MNEREVMRTAWESINANKLRSLLTMLGVIIGVAAVIMMVGISAGTEATISDQITSLGSNLLFIQPSQGFGGPNDRGGSGVFLTLEDATAIGQQVQGVEGVSTERDTDQNVKAGLVTLTNVPIVGTTQDFPVVRSVKVASGRFFNATEVDRSTKVVVLGATLATNMFGSTNPIGQTVTAGTTQMTVIGILAPKGIVGNADFDAQMYAPITLVSSKFFPSRLNRVLGDRVGLIYVSIAPKADMQNVTLQIQALLAKRHNVSIDSLPFTIRTQQDIIQTQEASTAAFRDLLAWVAAVSLVVGGIGIMNIMLVSVTERTREIGIRQAIGATPADVRAQFLSEALVLSLVGGLIGVATGVGGSWAFEALGSMRTVVVPISVLGAFLSAAVVGIFFGFYPANKASQLDPIEALRYE